MSKNQKIEIEFSDEDLHELKNGEEFQWTFDGITVNLFNEWTSDYDTDNEIEGESPTNLFIGLTESDIAELMDGEEFDWTYQTIDCHLYNQDFAEQTEED